jgi:long-chain acyl-CoA synthetase
MDEPAVWSGDRRRSYPKLHERAARMARGLDALGVEPGDRVAIVLRNEPAFLECTTAVRTVGAVPVPINWHWGESEIRYLLQDSRARCAFVHADLLQRVEAALPGPVELIEVPTPPELIAAYRVGERDAAPSGRHPELESWMSGQRPWREPPRPASMSMIYTSGTTGRPKGIIRDRTTAEQDKTIAGLVMSGYGLTPDMHTMVPAPLYHSAPNAHAGLAVALGMSLTIMPRFDAEELLRLIQDHRVEHVQMVPTMFVRLLRMPPEVRERYDLSSLRAVVHAAAPCPPDVKRAMIDWWGPIIHEFYGGSEVGIAVSCTSEQWLAHPGTVGAPVADAVLRILGPDGGEVPNGEVGEVYIRPPAAWPDFTYINDPAKRAGMERDGFLSQGDIGHLDAGGFLHLSDRVSDMVISGGVNIYPAEIEHCLLGLEGVRDVAVVGIPDPDLGEALAAHVDADPSARLTEQDIRDHVRRELAAYKVPKVVVFDDNLPREDTGKLFKRRIRDRYLRATTGQP